MKARVLFVALTVFVGVHAQAYEPEEANVNLASDYSQCYAYFMIASEGARRHGNEALAKQYQDAAESALSRGAAMSNPEISTARAELALKDQMRQMKHHYSNMEILTLRYGELCKQLMESPERRLQYWIDQ